MNKLMGFFELRELNIPTVPWKRYSEDVLLADNILWTLRVALKGSSDLNLPRLVGVTAEEAAEKGRELLQRYRDTGMVIYYPYFIADKSGVADIGSDRIVLEAVDKDLWNLVTYGRKNVTIVLKDEEIDYTGERDFLSADELEILQTNINKLKSKYRNNLREGKSMIAEWSFAYNTDINREPVGEKYLVFYELRSII